MKKISLFEALYMSFYSKRLYREVVASWGGYAILYLFMLVTLSWIGAVWQIQDALSLGYKKYSYDIVEQIPVLSIEHGIVSTPRNKPYLINDPYTNKLLAIIDVTGKYKNLDKSDASLLVTKTEVIFNKNDKYHQTRTYQIPRDYTKEIYPVAISNYLHSVVGYLWIPILIAGILFSFMYRLIQAFIYGLIGLLFNYFYGNTRLTYGQIVQIAMIAVTPAVVISTIHGLIGYPVRHLLPLYFFLSILYVFYGIVANSNSSNNKDAT